MPFAEHTKTRSLIARWVVSSAALFITSTVAVASSKTITIGATQPAGDISVKSMEVFGERLSRHTDGRYKVNIIPGAVLGSDREHLQQVSTGEIDIYLTSGVVLQHAAPKYQCLEAEYVFANEDHGFAVWRGDIGKEVDRAITEAYGVSLKAIGRRGARHISANRAIRRPEDLAGVKIRVTNQLRARVFTEFGAQPAPLPFSELYGALRQGVFDAQENPLSTIYNARFHEPQTHISLTQHVWNYSLVLVNNEFYRSLGDDKRAFDLALEEAMDWLYTAAGEEEEKMIQAIKADGLEFVKPDIAVFRERAKPVVRQYAEENCRPGLLDDIDRLVK